MNDDQDAPVDEMLNAGYEDLQLRDSPNLSAPPISRSEEADRKSTWYTFVSQDRD